MSEQSANLSLSYLMSNQAQKHVTLNESLRRLDAIVQLSVDYAAQAEPTGSEPDGTRYIVADGAVGLFEGQDSLIAAFQDGAWAFIPPRTGWLVWDRAADELLVWSGTSWVKAALPALPDKLGVNAAADESDRFVVAGEASLFSHDGGGHQLKINKQASAETASMLFQTGFGGRAEMGTTGSDDFEVKVSADGSSWTSSLRADASTGELTAPQGIRLGAAHGLLDHFEEGSWSPELTGLTTAGTPVYTANAGEFVRLGSMVLVSGRLLWSSLGGLEGPVMLGGLPFACRSGLEHRYRLTTSWFSGFAASASYGALAGYTDPGGMRFRLWGTSDANDGATAFIQHGDLTASGALYFSALYATG